MSSRLDMMFDDLQWRSQFHGEAQPGKLFIQNLIGTSAFTILVLIRVVAIISCGLLLPMFGGLTVG